MNEELGVQTLQVYEPPVLAEAGGFAEETQGSSSVGLPEGDGSYNRPIWW
ncbi:lasso RiPP family leader peptide-containing protein [Amycolatopsis coloradensis]|nr:lasso RiPP family leader peptide-containing protein [Amycolatopsis coloradensis]